MSKIDNLTKEYLSTKKRLRDIKDELDKIREKETEEKAKSMLGKCYALKAREGDESEPNMFARIENYCQRGNVLVGTQVDIYESNPEEVKRGVTIDGDMITININHNIFESWISNGYEITREEFDKKLSKSLGILEDNSKN